MKIKIVSDGTPCGTKVLSEDGQELDYIKSINWYIDHSQLAIANISFMKVPVVLLADLQYQHNKAEMERLGISRIH